MKYLFTFLLLTIINISYGQKTDTIIVVENDSVLVYRGECSSDVRFKNEASYSRFIAMNMSDELRVHIINNKIKGRIMFLLLIDTAGDTEVLGVMKSVDPHLEEELSKIFKKMKWDPARDMSGYPVNRLIMIPVVL